MEFFWRNRCEHISLKLAEDILLKAMNYLNDSYFLIVAGETYGSFEKYDEIIKSARLENKVAVFNNYIDDSEVKNYFSAADVCVLPYKSATQSGITNISYNFELPIIATNVGGLAETIIHEKTGLIVNQVSEKAIADSIHTFFNDNDSNDFSVEIKKINEENNWENFALRLIDFYKKLK